MACVLCILAHLSRRLTCELIGLRIGRRPASAISKKNISEASGPILVKFNVNHHWVIGLWRRLYRKCGFHVNDSSHRLTIGKPKNDL